MTTDVERRLSDLGAALDEAIDRASTRSPVRKVNHRPRMMVAAAVVLIAAVGVAVVARQARNDRLRVATVAPAVQLGDRSVWPSSDRPGDSSTDVEEAGRRFFAAIGLDGMRLDRKSGGDDGPTILTARGDRFETEALLAPTGAGRTWQVMQVGNAALGFTTKGHDGLAVLETPFPAGSSATVLWRDGGGSHVDRSVVGSTGDIPLHTHVEPLLSAIVVARNTQGRVIGVLAAHFGTSASTAANAAAALQAVDARPLLLPELPQPWSLAFTTQPHNFSATFTRDGGRRVTIAITVANPGPGSARAIQRTITFRGDPDARYQSDDAANPVAHRWLMWREPGSWHDETEPTWTGGPPYLLDADGLTDQEFWAVAASLTDRSTSSAESAPSRTSIISSAEVADVMARTTEVDIPSEHFAATSGWPVVSVSDGNGGSLTAVIGVRSASADGKGQLVFLWHNGHFVGCDADTAAFSIVGLASVDNRTIEARYAEFGTSVVTTASFSWNGHLVVAGQPRRPADTIRVNIPKS